MENTAVQTQSAQSNGVAEEIEKKKKTLWDYLKEIIEMFRKPYYGAAMKSLEENLNTMGYNNAATAAVLDNLISVTGEIKGKLTGDMSEEKAQEIMQELQEKISAISNEMADMKSVVDVLSADGVNGTSYALYQKDGTLYLSKPDDSGLIGNQAYLVDIATSQNGVKNAFVCKLVDVDPLESEGYKKVELVDPKNSYIETMTETIIRHSFSENELQQQTANKELIRNLQDNFNKVIMQSSESLFYEKDDGKRCSYINKDGNFCVVDREQDIMFVFVQDEKTAALRAECYKCNADLQAEGERLFIAGEWTNHNDTIRFKRTENETLNLSSLYNFEPTITFLKNHNISDEHIAALKNDISTPAASSDTLTKKGATRIKALYKELSTIPEAKNEGLNVEINTSTGSYLRFTSKSGNVTQINYDKNGDATNVEYRANGEQTFKKIQQITGGMTTVLAKPPIECEAVMELMKKAHYSIAEKKNVHTKPQQKPKEKIKMEEKSSDALWSKAESDHYQDRVQAALDEHAGSDIMQYLAKDENSFVRRAVAGVVTAKALVEVLANDKDESVRAEIAKRGLQPEVLAKDTSALVRAELANSGNKLAELITDPEETVRAAVARQGYGLSELLNDTSEMVRNSVKIGLGDIPKEVAGKLLSEYPADRAAVAYECKDNEKVMNILANDPQKRVRIAVAENGGALSKLVNDREAEVRLAVARQGYGYEVLKNDTYTPIRAEIAKQGYDLKNYIADPAVEVRLIVAQQGAYLNELSRDKDETVRIAVAQTASRREHSDVLNALVEDRSPAVRIALAERGYGLDTLLQDKDENVRAAVAKHDEVYADKLKNDKSEVVRHAARPEPEKPTTTKERD
jgi:hypothetical protein